MKVLLAGPGAFGIKHLDGMQNIDGVEVVSLVGRTLEKTRAVAQRYGIGHVSTDLGEALAATAAEAVILCTPTQQHAAEAIQCLQAGKPVQVEIPLADSWADAEAVSRAQQASGLVCMVGHTRRFNPCHQWLRQRLADGELNIQQMDVQTYFFAARTSTPGAKREAGQTIYCGTTPRICHTNGPTRADEVRMSADDPRAIIDHAPMSGFQVMAVLICILLNALDGFDVLAISFAAPGIAEEWSIDRAALGVVLATELLGMAMGSIVIGALADRYGRRPTILLCLVLMSAGMYLASITRSVDQLLLTRLVTGLGIGGMLASTNAMVAEYACRRRRSLAVVLMASGYPLGATLGGWVSSRLLEGGDWRVVFEFGALCTGAFIAVVWFLLPESIQYLSRARPANALQRVNRTLARMGHAPLKRLGRPPPKEQALRFADLFAARFRRVSILLCLGYFFHIMTFYFILKWIPKIVVDMGYAASSAGMVLVWANIGGMIGSLTFGILSQRFALRPLLIAVLIVAFAMVSAFGSGPSTLPMLSALAAAVGCFTNAGVVGFYALIAASYPADVRAGGTGMVIGLGRGGAVLGPVIAGILFTWGAGLLVTSVLMGAGALLAAACLYGLRDPSGDT